MATKTIAWNTGSGNITLTYTGQGNGSVLVSSDINEEIDREQSIKVETTDKSISAILVVSQVGLREVFNALDDEFILADNTNLNVLKDGLQ